MVLGLPLPIFSELLSIGGKSLVEYTYSFLLGYYLFSKEIVVCKVEKRRWILLGTGLAATVINVYLFLWIDGEYNLVNDIAKYISKWIVVIALTGTKYNKK